MNRILSWLTTAVIALGVLSTSTTGFGHLFGADEKEKKQGKKKGKKGERKETKEEYQSETLGSKKDSSERSKNK
jgi:hypothetical protein